MNKEIVLEDILGLSDPPGSKRNFWQPSFDSSRPCNRSRRENLGSVKPEVENARVLIGSLQQAQYEDRERLKTLDDKNSPRARELRRRLYQRRLGQKGLRALNKKLYGRSCRG